MLTGKDLGDLAESLACQYLRSKGYEILARNYRKPWGEIDIIARHSDGIVFIEVKANAKDYGSSFQPEIRVNPKKVATIQKTASLFLEYELGNLEQPWQIDIVAVTLVNYSKKAKITHFRNISEALW